MSEVKEHSSHDYQLTNYHRQAACDPQPTMDHMFAHKCNVAKDVQAGVMHHLLTHNCNVAKDVQVGVTDGLFTHNSHS